MKITPGISTKGHVMVETLMGVYLSPFNTNWGKVFKKILSDHDCSLSAPVKEEKLKHVKWWPQE